MDKQKLIRWLQWDIVARNILGDPIDFYNTLIKVNKNNISAEIFYIREINTLICNEIDER